MEYPTMDSQAWLDRIHAEYHDEQQPWSLSTQPLANTGHVSALRDLTANDSAQPQQPNPRKLFHEVAQQQQQPQPKNVTNNLVDCDDSTNHGSELPLPPAASVAKMPLPLSQQHLARPVIWLGDGDDHDHPWNQKPASPSHHHDDDDHWNQKPPAKRKLPPPVNGSNHDDDDPLNRKPPAQQNATPIGSSPEESHGHVVKKQKKQKKQPEPGQRKRRARFATAGKVTIDSSSSSVSGDSSYHHDDDDNDDDALEGVVPEYDDDDDDEDEDEIPEDDVDDDDVDDEDETMALYVPDESKEESSDEEIENVVDQVKLKKEDEAVSHRAVTGHSLLLPGPKFRIIPDAFGCPNVPPKDDLDTHDNNSTMGASKRATIRAMQSEQGTSNGPRARYPPRRRMPGKAARGGPSPWSRSHPFWEPIDIHKTSANNDISQKSSDVDGDIDNDESSSHSDHVVAAAQNEDRPVKLPPQPGTAPNEDRPVKLPPQPETNVQPLMLRPSRSDADNHADDDDVESSLPTDNQVHVFDDLDPQFSSTAGSSDESNSTTVISSPATSASTTVASSEVTSRPDVSDSDSRRDGSALASSSEDALSAAAASSSSSLSGIAREALVDGPTLLWSARSRRKQSKTPNNQQQRQQQDACFPQRKLQGAPPESRWNDETIDLVARAGLHFAANIPIVPRFVQRIRSTRRLR